MRGDHSRLQHQPHAKSIDTHVVADRVQALYAQPHQRRNQIFRNTAETEAAQHDRRARRNIGYRRIGALKDLVHPDPPSRRSVPLGPPASLPSRRIATISQSTPAATLCRVWKPAASEIGSNVTRKKSNETAGAWHANKSAISLSEEGCCEK